MSQDYNRLVVNKVFRHLCRAYSSAEEQPADKRRENYVQRHKNSISNELLKIEEELKSAINQNPEDSINKILERIDNMDKKINAYIETKTEREKRLKELEDKINSKSNKNFNEMLTIEGKINGFEKKLEEMTQKYGKNHSKVKKLKTTIASTKKKINRKINS